LGGGGGGGFGGVGGGGGGGGCWGGVENKHFWVGWVVWGGDVGGVVGRGVPRGVGGGVGFCCVCGVCVSGLFGVLSLTAYER